MTLLEERRILLGVTGSIAAYKAVDAASKLTQLGAHVDVIMTEAAQRFVTPLTFQAVTGQPVYTDLWGAERGGLPTHIAHVGLAENADLLAVIPATADTLARLANGFADDLLTITALAARCPLLVAPAMDGGMYEHPATQTNVAVLRERGALIVEPEQGRFASGLHGRGRLPATHTLIGAMRMALGRGGMLHNRKVTVTAGGTREPLDPVRYITNRSSGKQGHAIAQAAIDAGAEVTLITAARNLPDPYGARVIHVETAVQMYQAVMNNIVSADALIMAAAVADFQPHAVAEQKIKKTEDARGGALSLTLERTPDILMAVKDRRRDTRWPRVIVGFAAESENLAEHARDKLARKGLDLIVANDITATDAGFESDNNRVTIFDARGDQQTIELASKTRISEYLVRRVANLLTSDSRRRP
ncbi:MAG: bifunctional phosphopantothenoylcysteine decarboxylase/phosphopantothenate--cysteine ligase CoaBC [Chloroflexi bacterium]|nr:bifunctional phosphopantothenoylcysteine decarboxylase/phosphopantothenate--cysteine ligase CoaBC [Chloroflexota bacterium]